MSDGKRPYAIARTDGAPLAFAGLWEGWKAPDDTVLRTFTICTTTANRTMRQLHDRMPVVLEPADWPVWLGEAEGDAPALLHPAADDVLHLWPVSRAVNNVRNNTAELLDRMDDPHAPPPSDCPAGGECDMRSLNGLPGCRPCPPRRSRAELVERRVCILCDSLSLVTSSKEATNIGALHTVLSRDWPGAQAARLRLKARLPRGRCPK